MAYKLEYLQAVYDMARTEGWMLLREHIEREIRVAAESLVSIDMERPIRAAALQGEIRGLRRVLSHVDFVIDQITKREDEM